MRCPSCGGKVRARSPTEDHKLKFGCHEPNCGINFIITNPSYMQDKEVKFYWYLVNTAQLTKKANKWD